jgi:DHA3 family tetracycline resistance protein-like MFS transporter
MRPRAYPVWLSLNVASAFMESLVWTVLYVYYVTVVEMTPFELVVVGTVMEIAVFLFEVPTGVVADTYSRRLSIVISFAVVGASYAAIAANDSVPWILAANAVLGIGLTFSSGALQAWVTDEVGGQDLERVFLAGSRIAYPGALLGIGGSVALALVDIRLAIAAGAAVSIAIAVGLALFMPERGLVPARHEGIAAWRGVARNAAQGVRIVRTSWVLVVIVVITAFFGASTEALDRLTEAHFIREVGLPGDFEPVVWFGIISVIGLVGGFVVASVLLRRLKPSERVRTVEILFAADAVLAIALLVFAFAGNFWIALAALFVARRARGLRGPFFTAWLNQNTGSNLRATVNSLVGQSDAIGQVGGGPVLGALGTLASVRVALASSAALLLPALALYTHALRRGGRVRPQSGRL